MTVSDDLCPGRSLTRKARFLDVQVATISAFHGTIQKSVAGAIGSPGPAWLDEGKHHA